MEFLRKFNWWSFSLGVAGGALIFHAWAPSRAAVPANGGLTSSLWISDPCGQGQVEVQVVNFNEKDLWALAVSVGPDRVKKSYLITHHTEEPTRPMGWQCPKVQQ